MAGQAQLDAAGIRHALISNVLGLNAFAFDMERFELLDTIFTPDIEILFPTGPHQGRAAVRAELEQRRARYSSTQTPWHLIHNVTVVEATATTASVATRFSFGLMEEGQPGALIAFGWYDDTFVLGDDGWRMHRRRMLAPSDR